MRCVIFWLPYSDVFSLLYNSYSYFSYQLLFSSCFSWSEMLFTLSLPSLSSHRMAIPGQLFISLSLSLQLLVIYKYDSCFQQHWTTGHSKTCWETSAGWFLPQKLNGDELMGKSRASLSHLHYLPFFSFLVSLKKSYPRSKNKYKNNWFHMAYIQLIVTAYSH